MKYNMQEGYLTLPGGDWQDHSVNMLGAKHLPVKGTNLVITRELLPAGLSPDDYLLNQKTILSRELPAFQVLADTPETVSGLPARFLEVTWDNRGNAMHQMLLIIFSTDKALNLTATVPGQIDEESRAALMTVMKSFTAVPAPQQTKEA